MLLQACLNGARRPGDHPALPGTPAAVAADVVRVVAAGAAAVHVHPKDADGVDTLNGAELAELLAAVRALAPGVPVGTTTGAWAMPDPADRAAAVRRWPVVPDFASVNWHEPGAEQVAAAPLARGVEVEAGLWHADAVTAWLRSPLRSSCTRVLIELPAGLPAADTAAEADRLLRLLGGPLHLPGGLLHLPGGGAASRRPGGVQVLLHGEDSSCWPALRHAARLGLATRIGLEDVLELPDGSPAPDNAGLVAAARSVLDGTVDD